MRSVIGGTFVSNLVGTVVNITGSPITTFTNPMDYQVGAICYATDTEKIWVNVGGTQYTWRYITLT